VIFNLLSTLGDPNFPWPLQPLARDEWREKLSFFWFVGCCPREWLATQEWFGANANANAFLPPALEGPPPSLLGLFVPSKGKGAKRLAALWQSPGPGQGKAAKMHF
jgi:hypothetical protein